MAQITVNAQGEKAETVGVEFVYVPGTREEKLLVRNIDRKLMPCIWIMYIFNYLDRVSCLYLNLIRT